MVWPPFAEKKWVRRRVETRHHQIWFGHNTISSGQLETCQLGKVFCTQSMVDVGKSKLHDVCQALARGEILCHVLENLR